MVAQRTRVTAAVKAAAVKAKAEAQAQQEEANNANGKVLLRIRLRTKRKVWQARREMTQTKEFGKVKMNTNKGTQQSH
jgi:hypothetical protein